MVLREAAHIEGEVDVLGYTKYLDVWNHHSFLKNLKRSSVTPRDEQVLEQTAIYLKPARTDNAQGQSDLQDR